MRPVVKPALQLSWAIFAGTLIVCLIFVYLWYDGGAAAEQATRAREAYERRQGVLDLEGQIEAQRDANEAMALHIEEQKARVGIREVVPFVVPESDRKADEYFRETLNKIRQDLEQRAARRGSTKYNPDLGFGFLGTSMPQREDIDQWLLMLQLTTKACYLALSTPYQSSLTNVTIRDLGAGFTPVTTGPEGRPPLLREYRFTLEVDGHHEDIVWLLHQLSAEEPTPVHLEMQKWLNGPDGVTRKVYNALFPDGKLQPPLGTPEVSPLIVVDWEVTSDNETVDSQNEVLHAKIFLAGMEFLEPEERGMIAPKASGAGATTGIVGTTTQARRP